MMKKEEVVKATPLIFSHILVNIGGRVLKRLFSLWGQVNKDQKREFFSSSEESSESNDTRSEKESQEKSDGDAKEEADQEGNEEEKSTEKNEEEEKETKEEEEKNPKEDGTNTEENIPTKEGEEDAREEEQDEENQKTKIKENEVEVPANQDTKNEHEKEKVASDDEDPPNDQVLPHFPPSSTAYLPSRIYLNGLNTCPYFSQIPKWRAFAFLEIEIL